MKHGKRLKKRHKILIKSMGLNPDNWLIVKDTSDILLITHRYTGTTKTINKECG